MVAVGLLNQGDSRKKSEMTDKSKNVPENFNCNLKNNIKVNNSKSEFCHQSPQFSTNKD